MTEFSDDLESLTDRQFHIACSAYPFPYILQSGREKLSAHSLARRGWGTVEAGAGEDVLFRLNQQGENQVKFETQSWAQLEDRHD